MRIIDGIGNIPEYIGLAKASEALGKWLDKYPTINKVVMVANLVIRTVAMIALMYLLPFHPVANFAIGLGMSLFYNMTVERRFCPLRFAISACITAGAFEISRPFLHALINGVAFSSIAAFAAAFIGILPLAATVVVVILISNSQVDEQIKRRQRSLAPTSCCCEA